METLKTIQENYSYGFLLYNEYVHKVYDYFEVVGLSFGDELLRKYRAVVSAERVLRDEYPSGCDELESVANHLYALLAAEVECLVQKLLK